VTSDFWFHHLKFYGRNIKALRPFYYSDAAYFVVPFFNNPWPAQPTPPKLRAAFEKIKVEAITPRLHWDDGG